MRADKRQVNVLLVEDSRFVRELAASFLGDYGYAYSEAENGQQALDLLARSSFDLILLDIEMPVLGGHETAQRIRRSGSSVPILAMTGHDTEEEWQRCLRSGMNACITKPFEKDKLHTSMLALLDLFPDGKNLQVALPPIVEMPEGRVTDLSHLLQISKGRKDFFMSMIAIFLEQNSEDMKTLDAAIRKTDYDTVRLLAHKIATSVTFIGLEDHVVPQLKEMEQLGGERKNPLRISVLYHQVAAVCAKAEEELIAVQEKERSNEAC